VIARIAICLLAVLLLGCSKHQPTVAISDYGTYDAVVLTKGNWKLGFPVQIADVTDLKHKDTTTKIPCQDGIYWGLRAKVTNSYSDRPVRVSFSIKHPPFTSPDGKTSAEETSPVAVLEPNQTIDVPSLWFFIDSCPFEFVPGEWTFQIIVDGKVEASKIFEVYKP